MAAEQRKERVAKANLGVVEDPRKLGKGTAMRTTLRDKRHTLDVVSSTTDQALASAHALVKHAEQRASAMPGLAGTAAAGQCFEAAALLEDCGAVPDADLLMEAPAGEAIDLLQRAAAVLDELEPSERPLRLGAARVELASALLTLDDATGRGD